MPDHIFLDGENQLHGEKFLRKARVESIRGPDDQTRPRRPTRLLRLVQSRCGAPALAAGSSEVTALRGRHMDESVGFGGFRSRSGMLPPHTCEHPHSPSSQWSWRIALSTRMICICMAGHDMQRAYLPKDSGTAPSRAFNNVAARKGDLGGETSSGILPRSNCLRPANAHQLYMQGALSKRAGSGRRE